jgi:formate--tetrahydrofolate ligase
MDLKKELEMPLSDLDIAKRTSPKPIIEIGASLGLTGDDLELYGPFKAKISAEGIRRFKNQKEGKLILVTAINPTPAGEGKSTTTVGLGQAFGVLNKKAIVALREPSLGPVFGVKGGAAGGGYAQVIPMEDLNLHFTGDIHAVTTANNLISAVIDNHLHQGNELNIDIRNITWKRALDMNDRSLRNITIGLGGKAHSVPREEGFNITVASEVMAVLTLAEDVNDLKTRLKRMVIGYNLNKEPVTVGDLGIEGAVAMVLKDAIKPNLVQTLEHTPVLVHGGPFANIAHGCNSIIATKLGLKMADYVITEAGFGADLGAEKFLDIKAQEGNLTPSVVVIVATIRALKMHGGLKKDQLKEEDVSALKKGFKNLEKHIETIQNFGLPYVVAINAFDSDTKQEIDTLHELLDEKNHPFALSEVFKNGGQGGVALAEKVLTAIEQPSNYQPLYQKEDTLENKIKAITSKAYGATHVEFSAQALSQLRSYKKLGWDQLRVCMAKTQYSLTDDPTKLGRPEDFTITIRELRPSIGAGFIVALTGDVMTMPGLPKVPSAVNMGLNEDGSVEGLF